MDRLKVPLFWTSKITLVDRNIGPFFVFFLLDRKVAVEKLGAVYLGPNIKDAGRTQQKKTFDRPEEGQS